MTSAVEVFLWKLEFVINNLQNYVYFPSCLCALEARKAVTILSCTAHFDDFPLEEQPLVRFVPGHDITSKMSHTSMQVGESTTTPAGTSCANTECVPDRRQRSAALPLSGHTLTLAFANLHCIFLIHHAAEAWHEACIWGSREGDL